MNPVLNLLMTSIDLQNENVLNMAQTKARNPKNTVAATNPVFDLLKTSNDL